MIGSIDEEPLRFEAVIPLDNWIAGIVLHIPAIEFVGTDFDDVGETSPKGITVGISNLYPIDSLLTDRASDYLRIWS